MFLDTSKGVVCRVSDHDDVNMAPGGDDQRKGRTQRATPRTAWLCISCTNPKGERWHNKADALQCTGRCKRPKGLCFGQKAGKGGCPTVSVRAQQAAKHEEELKRLRAENEALMEKVAAVDAAVYFQY